MSPSVRHGRDFLTQIRSALLATGRDSFTFLGPSVEVVAPVRRDSALGTGHGLFARMVPRWRQRWAVQELVRAVVVEPILAGLEATDNWVVLRTGVPGGMLARRVVAATDMATFSAAAKVEPPASRFEAFDAPRTAGGDRGDYRRITHQYNLYAEPFLGRGPLPFETSRPGLFAVGDVRSGSTKRVAAAVDEASAAVRSVHRAPGLPRAVKSADQCGNLCPVQRARTATIACLPRQLVPLPGRRWCDQAGPPGL